MRVAIPLFPGFAALDVAGPFEVLSRLPETEVTLVAESRGPVPNENGWVQLVATHSFEEIRQADVLVVPGGFGTRRLMETSDGALIQWLRRVHDSSLWTASVCTGALLLGAAGILEGLEATTHWLQMDLLRGLGATPVARRVVFQGKVVTSAGVSAGIDMALALAARIAGDRVAKAIQLAIEYDPEPPFDAGSPAGAGPEITETVRARIEALLAAQRGA